LFSSAAGVLGSPGQSNYGAANAFVDSFAESTSSARLHVCSVGWGPWAADGMASSKPLSRQVAGIKMIEPSDGLAALEAALSGAWRPSLVLPISLEEFAQYYPEGPGFALFADVAAENMRTLRNAGASATLASRPALTQAFVAPRSRIERVIAGIWSRALGVDAVGVHDGFFELGGDSVLGNQMLIDVRGELGLSIEPEEVFDSLTIEKLAAVAEAKARDMIENLDEEEVLARLSAAQVSLADTALA
jgi:hypothetical protein